MSDLLNQLHWVRVACVAPELRLGDIDANISKILEALGESKKKGADLVLFPELSLGGYSVGDLHFQSVYLEANLQGLCRLASDADPDGPAFVVGLPLVFRDQLLNVAAFVSSGKILGLVPKVAPSQASEGFLQRGFVSGEKSMDEAVHIGESVIPLGADLIFTCQNLPKLRIGIEVGNHLQSPSSPGCFLSQEEGALLILNPATSSEIPGRASLRRDLIRARSLQCMGAIAFASGGAGESSTDSVSSGHLCIAESGALIAEECAFSFDTSLVLADIDLDKLTAERIRESSFFSDASFESPSLAFEIPAHRTKRSFLHPISPTPFIPDTEEKIDLQCEEIFAIQSTGLARRMRQLETRHLVVGISGGLDSALALLVCAQVFDRMGLDRSGIQAIVMPGPGTSSRTHANAEDLVQSLGATLRMISITQAVERHLEAIGHEKGLHDVTFENTQARERTKILMDISNQCGGFVVGTGDLSEAALGWCTFNGDHMAMYNVNAGVPKTLIRSVLTWAASHRFDGQLNMILSDILATPVSPELLPAHEDGSIHQETEKILGPYEVHDFFLYYFCRYGFPPSKILELAAHAFEGRWKRRELAGFLRTFLRRFFTQQFKRSTSPDGPATGVIGLSPRGYWQMPSDASCEVWLKELEKATKEDGKSDDV